MAQLKNFIVCFGCNGRDYLTRVSAVSLSGAEHIILDLSISGKHAYGVSYAQAFDGDSIKTDTFAGLALSAVPISATDARKIIEDYNAVIRMQDEREKRIDELKAQIEELQGELASLCCQPDIPF